MFEKSNWTLANKTSYVYSTVNGVKVLDDWTVISKLNYLLKKQVRIYPTLLHLYTSNLLFRVNNSNRFLVGAGISPLNDDLFFLVGVGLENTNYAQEVFKNSDLIGCNRNFGMSTIYIENAHHFANKKLALKYTAFYIHSFKEAGDYTVWITPSLNVVISKKISFAINYDFRYRNVHLIEFPAINESFTFNVPTHR